MKMNSFKKLFIQDFNSLKEKTFFHSKEINRFIEKWNISHDFFWSEVSLSDCFVSPLWIVCTASASQVQEEEEESKNEYWGDWKEDGEEDSQRWLHLHVDRPHYIGCVHVHQRQCRPHAGRKHKYWFFSFHLERGGVGGEEGGGVGGKGVGLEEHHVGVGLHVHAAFVAGWEGVWWHSSRQMEEQEDCKLEHLASKSESDLVFLRWRPRWHCNNAFQLYNPDLTSTTPMTFFFWNVKPCCYLLNLPQLNFTFLDTLNL